MSLALKPITQANVRAVCELRVKPEQLHLVATNAESLAQAYVHPEAWPRALYADAPIGFVMLEDWSLIGTPQL